MGIRYQPDASWTQESNVAQFIQSHGLRDRRTLYQKAIAEPEWFWTECLKATGLSFYTPPKQILGKGLPWPSWAIGGQISIVENCIDRHLKKNASSPALIFENDENTQNIIWSFEDLARESSWVAQQLKASGATETDRAAIIMPMSLEMCAAFFGCLRLGLSVVPIFSGYGEEAIKERLQDAKIKFAFVPKKATRRAKEVDVAGKVKKLQADCPNLEKIFVLDREDFIAGHPCEVIEPAVKPAEAECLLLYTSGTTGKPKACVHTVFGVLATCGKEHYFSFDVKKGDRFFWYTDIGWMMGPWELFGALQLGSSVILFDGVPDFPGTNRLWEILKKHHVTHFGVSPTAIRMLKKADESFLSQNDFPDLRVLGSTGEPWDEESWVWFFQKVGKSKRPIINISGGTEIMGCLLSPDPLSELKPMSLSGPALGVNAQVWSESGEALSSGLGHLVCLSPLPSMTKGFLNSKEKYLQTYFEKFGEEVWYHGDWALIDDDGFWFLKGRSDDTIKIAGKRVGPNEFESCIMENHKIAEVAAVGFPHEIKGECVYLFVVTKKVNDATEDLKIDLQTQVISKMGKALAPEKLFFVQSLPKTRSGKILRSMIRKVILNESFDPATAENQESLEQFKGLL